ncbi:MAG: alpha/beta hydrolase [Myxococcota bacterium]|nr:alpha/beta hydrolase [Myxococcota bacterium]
MQVNPELGEGIRQASHGDIKFSNLGTMAMAYLRWGRGPNVVVALHGFPDTPFSMAPFAHCLPAEQYTVVAPFLRGYAPTDFAPDGRYDIEALANDIQTFIRVNGFIKPCLVGHDWGAVIGYAVGASSPELIKRHIAISVPPMRDFRRYTNRSLRQAKQSLYVLGFQFPGLAEYRLRRNLSASITSVWARWSPDWTPPPFPLECAIKTLEQPGVLEAALAYYRQARPGFSQRRRAAWRLFEATARCPTVCLVGERDRCIAPDAFGAVTHPVHIISNAGHFLPLEVPEVLASFVMNS